MVKEQTSKERLKAYLKPAVIFIILSVLCMLFLKPFSKETAEETLRTVIDVITIPSVFFLGVSIISKVGAWGGYDMLGFAASRFTLHNFIPGIGTKTVEDKKSYYEYKQEKNEKGRRWLKEVFFVGLAGLVLCLIMLAVYYGVIR